MYFRISIFFFVSIFLSSLSVKGQGGSSGLLWTDFNYANFVKPKLSLGGDGGYRVNLSSTSWNAVYLRPTVKYRIDERFVLGGSIAGFQNFNGDAPNTFEFRGAQEVQANWPNTKRLEFFNRLRMEERWLFYESPSNAEETRPNDWSPRLRYRLRMETEVFNIGEVLSNVFIHSSIEYFLSLGSDSEERYFNRSRLVAGWGQLLKNNRKYEIDLMWQQSRNTLDGDFESDEFVLRLRYFFKKLPSS